MESKNFLEWEDVYEMEILFFKDINDCYGKRLVTFFVNFYEWWLWDYYFMLDRIIFDLKKFFGGRYFY